MKLIFAEVLSRYTECRTVRFFAYTQTHYSKRVLDYQQSLNREENVTYDEVVREMLIAESQYIRDLNMIIKVFSAVEFTPYISQKFLALFLQCYMAYFAVLSQVFKAPFEEAKDIFSQKVCLWLRH